MGIHLILIFSRYTGYNEDARISGSRKFRVKDKKEWPGRNLQTREEMMLQSARVVTLKCSPGFGNKLKRAAHPCSLLRPILFTLYSEMEREASEYGVFSQRIQASPHCPLSAEYQIILTTITLFPSGEDIQMLRVENYCKAEGIPTVVLWLTVSVACLCPGHREASAQELVYETKLTAITYHHPSQLIQFSKGIKPTAFIRTLDKLFRGKEGISTTATLGEFVDTLFEKVQGVLDMPQPGLRVTIRLLEDRGDLSEAYASVSSPEGSALRAKTFAKAPIAFYWQKTNTIYLQMEDLSIGILAHEMAHAVIDHYFIIRPPAKIAEMLCQYVDRQISSGRF
jgi:hypothetical protein